MFRRARLASQTRSARSPAHDLDLDLHAAPAIVDEGTAVGGLPIGARRVKDVGRNELCARAGRCGAAPGHDRVGGGVAPSFLARCHARGGVESYSPRVHEHLLGDVRARRDGADRSGGGSQRRDGGLGVPLCPAANAGATETNAPPIASPSPSPNPTPIADATFVRMSPPRFTDRRPSTAARPVPTHRANKRTMPSRSAHERTRAGAGAVDRAEGR